MADEHGASGAYFDGVENLVDYGSPSEDGAETTIDVSSVALTVGSGVAFSATASLAFPSSVADVEMTESERVLAHRFDLGGPSGASSFNVRRGPGSPLKKWPVRRSSPAGGGVIQPPIVQLSLPVVTTAPAVEASGVPTVEEAERGDTPPPLVGDEVPSPVVAAEAPVIAVVAVEAPVVSTGFDNSADEEEEDQQGLGLPDTNQEMSVPSVGTGDDDAVRSERVVIAGRHFPASAAYDEINIFSSDEVVKNAMANAPWFDNLFLKDAVNAVDDRIRNRTSAAGVVEEGADFLSPYLNVHDCLPGDFPRDVLGTWVRRQMFCARHSDLRRETGLSVTQTREAYVPCALRGLSRFLTRDSMEEGVSDLFVYRTRGEMSYVEALDGIEADQIAD